MLHDGKIREFDPPYLLLENPKSLFSKMVHSLPEPQAALFKRIARDKHEHAPYKAPPQSLGGDGLMMPQYGGGGGVGGAGGGGNKNKAFLPSFQNIRLNSVLHNFSSTNFVLNKY